MGMGIDDTIGNGNGKEWESPCIRMGMALIPMGINSHPSADAVFSLYNSNVQFIMTFIIYYGNSAPLNRNC